MTILRSFSSKCFRYLSLEMSKNARRYGGAVAQTPQLRVLVDMDQVIADFEGHFLTLFRKNYPEAPYIPLEERTTFYINDQYDKLDPGLRVKTQGIIESQGFFRNLPPIDGAVDALKEMSSMEGVEVFLCTSPLSTGNHYCATEKFEWVQEHLGRDWTLRLILTRDKSVVNGHLLIDDKPKITGIMSNPAWKHILFTANHNKHFDLKRMRAVERLTNWTDGSWKDLILTHLHQL